MTDKKKLPDGLMDLDDTKKALAKDGKTLEDLIDQMAETEKTHPVPSYKPETNPLTGEDWDAEPNEGDNAPDLDGHDIG